MGLTYLLFTAGLALQFQAGTQFNGSSPPGLDRLLADLAWCVWAIVGAFLISRRPQNPIGWLFSLIALLLAMDEFAWGYAYYGSIAHPGSLPATWLMILWLQWPGVVLALFAATLLFLLFPSGRPLSPGWNKLVWICAGATGLYLIGATLHPLPLLDRPFPANMVSDRLGIGPDRLAFVTTLTWLTYIVVALGVIAANVSLLIRLNSAGGVERQQLKWFVFATAFSIPGIILLILGRTLDAAFAPVLFRTGLRILNFFTIAVACAAAIAILRYRLADIDIIIRRTLAYSILTGLVALIYLLAVVLMQALFGVAGGQSTPAFIIVLTTLLTAALFNPLRLRIQAAIDRSHYRKKYDPGRVLTDFAATTRDEVDEERLTSALAGIIEQTLQPELMSLWILRRPGSSGSTRSDGH